MFGLLGRLDVRVAFDGAGGDDEGGAGDAGRGVADDQVRVHSRHHVRIAGLADAGDAPVADADIRLHDAEFGIDDRCILNDDIERLVGVAHAGVEALAVAQRLAGADHQLMPRNRIVALDLGQQAGVAEPDQIALGRTVKLRVRPTTDGDHDYAPR